MSEQRATPRVKKPLERQPMDSHVEWLAWCLQLVVGFLVGCGVGYQVWRLVFQAGLNEMLLFVVAGGLICGAFTSFYGNRVWMACSIYLAPEPAPPRKARACSLIVGAAGVAVVFLTVVRHMVAAATRKQGSPATGVDVFLILVALVPGFLVVHALRRGTGLWIFGIIDREETPLMFWVYVLLNGVAALSVLSTAL
jgi:hypothetical protein